MKLFIRAAGAALFCVTLAAPSHAVGIPNPVARFTGLDKITGNATSFEVKINEEARFGRLIVKPYVCHTRPLTEEPNTTAFVEVDLLGADDKRTKIFSGWMFAESPGLNGVEDPTFDVWLTGCYDPSAPPPPVEVPPSPETQSEEEDAGQEQPAPAD